VLLLAVLAASLASAVLPAAFAGGVGTEASARGSLSAPGKRTSSPARRLASAQAGRKRLFPRFANGVPVLLYHRILPRNGGRGVSAETFDAQLQRLHDMGFETITLDQYVRFVHGDATDLPPRPVLITFDDGFRSALERADPVLARYGWSAVLYIPTSTVGRPGRLTWDELRQMWASGRWQIAEHAGAGHGLVTADAAGQRRPFYANEEWTNGVQESFANFKQRVRRDIERGSSLLARNLPGWAPGLSFAVPFGDYGQRGSNDPRIEPWLVGYLKSRFVVTFVQHDDSFTTPGPGLANRITVASDWSGNTLEQRLVQGLEGLRSSFDRNRAGQQRALRSKG
jgi:peptidoglycan/xylan/chitin deacetylase (PgdA/CDA1 family)